MKSILTMSRSGTFHVTNLTLHQCGVAGGQDFEYEVSLTASKPVLDSNGFLVDNNEIGVYFKNKYEVNGDPCLSCETLAIDAANHFLKTFSQIESVRVRIHGSNQTHFDFTLAL